MIAVITVVHLLIVLALIATVLLQRSEGGALGIGGGGGGGGGMFSSRGAGNALTRTTAILAVCFFLTSLSLAYLARGTSNGGSVLDQVAPSQGGQTQEQGGGSVLPTLPGTTPAPTGPTVPNQ